MKNTTPLVPLPTNEAIIETYFIPSLSEKWQESLMIKGNPTGKGNKDFSSKDLNENILLLEMSNEAMENIRS